MLLFKGFVGVRNLEDSMQNLERKGIRTWVVGHSNIMGVKGFIRTFFDYVLLRQEEEKKVFS